ncbi:hypothetical protein A2U01_0034627 [Trifolium medium]|uniref:Uncharacterized protein n=1 Tax=Trifolium medium TaxID=97028 RepID=A0A392PPU4_9FABA|nr:hypothetical protein [Trifolium medium]
MEEMGSSSSSTPLPNHKTSFGSSLKKSCLSFAVSIQETFRYATAFFVAKNEKEASEAELEATKKQVEAADAAEDIKNRLNNQHN